MIRHDWSVDITLRTIKTSGPPQSGFLQEGKCPHVCDRQSVSMAEDTVIVILVYISAIPICHPSHNEPSSSNTLQVVNLFIDKFAIQKIGTWIQKKSFKSLEKPIYNIY